MLDQDVARSIGRGKAKAILKVKESWATILRYLLDTASNPEPEEPARAIRIGSCRREGGHTILGRRGRGLDYVDWTRLDCAALPISA